MNADGTNVHQVAALTGYAVSSWAKDPNGGTEMTATDTHQNWDLLKLDDSLNVVSVTPLPFTESGLPYVNSAALSPDGSRLVYLVQENGGGASVWVSDSDGTNATKILGYAACTGVGELSPTIGSPVWAPDATRIAFTATPRGVCSTTNQPENVYSILPDGSGITQLTQFQTDCSTVLWPNAWSPDGTQLAFALGQIYDSNNTSCNGIATMNADGSGFAQVMPVTGQDTVNYVGWQPAPVCKAIFYVDAPPSSSPIDMLATGHAFIQLRLPNENVTTDGFYPATLSFFDGPGRIQDDSKSPWSYRLVYPLTSSQCDQAQNFITGLSSNPLPRYRLTGNVNPNGASAANCVGLVVDFANDLGLTLPPYAGVAGVPDPRTLALNMGLNLGFYHGGTIEANTNGSDAIGAPDPPPPVPEVGSPSGLALEALADGPGLASTLGFRYDASTLDSLDLAPGGNATLQRSTSSGPSAVYAIDWGDGSSPDVLVKPLASATDDTAVTDSHVYSTAGSYTEHLVALTGGGIESYTGTVAVGSGGASQAGAQFVVPDPPPATAFPPARTLTVSPAGTGSGSVSSNPAGITCPSACAQPFDNGSQVTLTAAPESGSTFAGWSGGGCSGTGTCTVTMSADQSVTATFTANPPPQQTLTVSLAGSGSGTVTGSGISCPGTCSTSFTQGTIVTLTAAPESGSTFAGWSGGGCSGTGTCTVTMSADQSVTATFNSVSPKPSCALTAERSVVFVPWTPRYAPTNAKERPPAGVLKLTARCDQAARLTLTGEVTAVAGKKLRSGMLTHSTRTFTVTVLRATSVAGRALTLTVKLPSAALAALKAGARESVAFTLTATNANGTGTTTAEIRRLTLIDG